MNDEQDVRIYHGKKAVRKVQDRWPDEWDDLMEPVVMAEGYAEGLYYDSKGIPTFGVGQTAFYSGVPFPEVFRTKLAQVKSSVPIYDDLPRDVQGSLLVAHYRGDWFGSPKTVSLFNRGYYTAAAKEYLDNDEYREAVLDDNVGIRKRFESVAKDIASLDV